MRVGDMFPTLISRIMRNEVAAAMDQVVKRLGFTVEALGRGSYTFLRTWQ
jgi:hypothetical protein